MIKKGINLKYWEVKYRPRPPPLPPLKLCIFYVFPKEGRDSSNGSEYIYMNSYQLFIQVQFAVLYNIVVIINNIAAAV